MNKEINYFPEGTFWAEHFSELSLSFSQEVLLSKQQKAFSRETKNNIRSEISTLIAKLKTIVDTPNTELISGEELYLLLRPEAGEFLEDLAQLSKTLTEVRFGSNIQFYAPLYLSNECNSKCIYCSFSRENKIERITLGKEELLQEAKIISEKGIRHILLLTGEDKIKTPVSYIAECIKIIKPYFASISLEIYALDVHEYKVLVDAGAEGLTLYQETYDPKVYSEVHLGGKKKNFNYRLHAPDRGGKAGFKKIGIGVLLGLSSYRADIFIAALHAQYLMKKYWKSAIALSLPRMRSAISNFEVANLIDDKTFAQMIFALRLFLPDVSLVLSTREEASFRDNMAGLGINVMSAGSKTEPGGYSGSGALTQFEIDDTREPDELAFALKKRGFNPVWKDWDSSLSEK